MKVHAILIVSILSLSPAFAIRNGIEAGRNQFTNIHKINFNSSFKTLGILTFNKSLGACTATIISDYTVLTAAHCIQEIRGTKSIKMTLAARSFQVEEIFIPEGYSAALSELNKVQNNDQLKSHYHRLAAVFDLALIRTRTKISQKLSRTKINFNVQNFNERVIAVGYGAINESSMSPLSGRPIHPRRPHYREEFLSEVFEQYYGISSEDNGPITTFGDSGSPLILADTNEQIGVLRGSVGPNTSLYASLAGHQSFIAENIK